MNLEETKEEERRYKEAARENAKTLDSRVLADPVRVLHPRPAIIVAPDATVLEVVGRMADQRQGCVVVVDGGAVVGIFTERDALTRVFAPGNDPGGTRVSEVMTPRPECVTLEDTLGFALHKMSVGSFRNIPVVDDDGQPVGVVTQQEGVKYLTGFFPAELINNPPRSIEQSPPRHQYGG